MGGSSSKGDLLLVLRNSSRSDGARRNSFIARIAVKKFLSLDKCALASSFTFSFFRGITKSVKILSLYRKGERTGVVLGNPIHLTCKCHTRIFTREYSKDFSQAARWMPTERAEKDVKKDGRIFCYKRPLCRFWSWFSSATGSRRLKTSTLLGPQLTVEKSVLDAPHSIVEQYAVRDIS